MFLDVRRKSAQFEARSKVSTWLLAIARDKTYTALERRTDAQLDEDFAQTIESPADGPASAFDKKDRSAVLAHCSTRLSPAHREIIEVYYHEKAIEEVAEIAGIPAALAQMLKEAGIEHVRDAERARKMIRRLTGPGKSVDSSN